MVVSEAVESSNWPQSDPHYIQDQKGKKKTDVYFMAHCLTVG